MNFGKAFEEVKKGKAMRLPQWSKDVVIKAQFPDENSKMTAPYLLWNPDTVECLGKKL